MEDLWERALQDLKGKLSSENFETWLAPLAVDRMDEATLTLRVPNKFYADWLQTHYLDLVRDALRNHGAPAAMRVDFSVVGAVPCARQRAVPVSCPQLCLFVPACRAQFPELWLP